MSKQATMISQEGLKLSSAIKSTDLNYQSTNTPTSHHIEPHTVYVELEELHEDDKTKKMEWVETARWLKYEEDMEKSERWGKPHVSSLSFHSLLELRRGFSKGIAVIDSREVTLQGVAHEALNEFVHQGILKREHKDIVLRALLLKHKNEFQSKKNKRKSLDFLTAMRNRRAHSLAPDKVLTEKDDAKSENKKRLSCPDEDLGRFKKIQRRISSFDPTFGARSTSQGYSKDISDPAAERRQSIFDRLQLKINEFKGRSSKSEDLESCVFTNVASEAPTLPALTEETMDEIQPPNEAKQGNTSNESKQGNNSNEAKQGNSSNETAEEREITEISDKLVSNILEKVKQDFMKCEQEIKQKRTGLNSRKTVSFMEPRKSTVGLHELNFDRPTLSPTAHFVLNNPLVVEEEEEEEDGVRVLDAITKHVETTSGSEEVQASQESSSGKDGGDKKSSVSDGKRRASTAQFLKHKLNRSPLQLLKDASTRIEKYMYPDQDKSNDRTRRFLRAGSLPPDCEAAPVLVAKLDFLTKPLVAFIRLADAQYFDDITEYYMPVRFLFLVIGPHSDSVDYHEVGRSIATIMSNQEFQQKMYSASSKEEVLAELNVFLNDSIVLPPGEYGADHILPKTLQKSIRKRKKQAAEIDEDKRVRYPVVGYTSELKEHFDPLSRTGRYFGGLIRDVKTLRKRYLSDIKDGMNLVTLESVLLMFGLMLAPAITFGGLAGKHTKGDYGVIEMLLSTCLGGVPVGRART
ncbi:anion exchange protein 3-like [Bolinopsis microptera]|uniref:anion exchange protein 3-like n=1 Tax=Bolinopsis microptera TaxID=2820187 RepID=UPI00307A10A5